MIELEIEKVITKLKKELRNNKITINDLMSQNSAYDAAIMMVEELIDREIH